MATLDIILLCCFIPGIIRGISKGFLEQALALAGIVLSVWAAFRFSSLVCTWLKPYLELSETTLNVVSFALILVAVSLLVFLVAKLLTKVAAFSNCLRFIVPTRSTPAKCSGAKVGMPSKQASIPFSQIVSPMEKMPGSNTPMMSPA